MNPPGRRWPGLLVIATVGFLAGGPIGAGLLGAAAITTPRLVARRRRAQARQHLGDDTAVIFELSARGVRTGMTLHEALTSAAERNPGPASELVVATLADLAPSTSGPDRTGRTVETTGTRDIVAAVLGMVDGTAGGTARGLDAGAMLLRERERARREVIAGASQAKASAALLTGAPAVLGVAGLALVPGGLTGVMARPAVLGAMALGVAFQAAGAWWNRHLIRAVERQAR